MNHRAERDRDLVRGEEDGDHTELREIAESLPRQDVRDVRLRLAEDLAALLRLLPDALELVPEHPSTKTTRNAPPTMIRIVSSQWTRNQPSSTSNAAPAWRKRRTYTSAPAIVKKILFTR